MFGLRTLLPLLRDDAADGPDEPSIPALGARPSFAAAAWSAGAAIGLAECGDRSMLSTCALAAAHDPMAVIMGSILGHVVATMLAVCCGSVLSARLPPRVLAAVAGGQLILLSLTSALGW